MISWLYLWVPNFSGDWKLQIMLLQLWISWSYLWLTNFSWDQKSKKTFKALFRLSISWKIGKKYDLLIIKTFNLLFWSPEIWPPEPHSWCILLSNWTICAPCFFYLNNWSIMMTDKICLNEIILDQLFSDHLLHLLM